jgi:hypothetical protein
MSTLRKAIILAMAAGTLAGCKLHSGEVQITDSLGSVSFDGGKTLNLSTGFGSGAYHRPGDPANVFWTVTDRGPNIACNETLAVIGIEGFCGADDLGKVFPQPDFTPTIYKIALKTKLRGDGIDYEILAKIPLKDAQGTPITGLPNPFSQTDTENAYDSLGHPVAFDVNGLDTEALVVLKNGTFWVAEEYGPSIVHVNRDGRILQRIVPATLEQDLASASYPVAGLLPEILKKRKLNRGAESIAVTPDQKFLYFALQNPLSNPNDDAYKASRNVRILKLALNKKGEVTSVVGEYTYVMDTAQTYADIPTNRGDVAAAKANKQSDVKVSEMFALAEDDLIVLERISDTTKLYRANLKTADNILGSALDDMSTTPSLEQVRDTALIGAKPAAKKLVFNSLTDVAPGVLPSKIEGVTLLDDKHLLLINDNDFGITNEVTRAVILDIGQKLSAGPAPATVSLSHEGTYASGVFGESAAEIVAHDPQLQRIYVVNANDGVVDVLDASTPSAPAKIGSINVKAAGPGLGAANSVAYRDGMIAVAIEAADKQQNGFVALYQSSDLSLLGLFEVGALPDMLTFTPDGKKILTANEGEPSGDYSVDPEGSVSIVDLSAGIASASVSQVRFTDFNLGGSRHAELPAGVRVFGPGASVAQDLEPEYIALSADGKTAWVSLQEANALAIINVNAASVTSIAALGFKDFSLAGNELDVSDRDNALRLGKWKSLKGVYMPDAIAAYQWNSKDWIVSANEGDSRDYSTYSEESRVGALNSAGLLSPALSADAANSRLGRLKVTTTLGRDSNGIYQELYAFGARSFSIWNALGQQVFDSGSDFERITAEHLPAHFNASNDDNSFDSRSDDKGPEPEGLATGWVNGHLYAFVGLERVGGIMVYDITNPYGPQYAGYLNHRDFTAPVDSAQAGDLGPEGLTFIPGTHMPDGIARLIVGNEVSGTTSIYQIK